jgi:hypothetical protein
VRVVLRWERQGGGGTWIPNIGWEGGGIQPEAAKKIVSLSNFVANWVAEKLLMVLQYLHKVPL